MAGGWSPSRTEAKAGEVLQDAQQSTELEEMAGLGGGGPKEDGAELPRAAGRHILPLQRAQAGSGSSLQRPTCEEHTTQ